MSEKQKKTKAEKGGLYGQIRKSISDISTQGSEAIQKATKKVSGIGKQTEKLVNNAKDQVIGVIDANGNGSIDIEDFIILGLRTP